MIKQCKYLLLSNRAAKDLTEKSQRRNWCWKRKPPAPPSTLPSLAATGDDASSRAESHEGRLSTPFAAWQALYERTENKLLVVEAVVATRLPWKCLGGHGESHGESVPEPGGSEGLSGCPPLQPRYSASSLDLHPLNLPSVYKILENFALVSSTA